MRQSQGCLRRLILGMSVEDAQSKFDSPEARRLLLHAHERHNLGILQELQLAQRQRNALAPERKCHITRFCKPIVRGFQACVKSSPEDYVVREVWPSSATAPREHTAAASREDQGGVVTETQGALLTTSGKLSQAAAPLPPSAAALSRLEQERAQFASYKSTILSALRAALDNVAANVLAELGERRRSGSLTAGQNMPLVDRLVGEVSAGQEKGYRSLSSSTHLLEPVEMTVTLYGKRDKAIAEAFRSTSLAVPAREGDISFSLWVAGGLIAHAQLCSEFPFHLAKYVVSDGDAAVAGDDDEDEDDDGDHDKSSKKTSGSRPPRTHANALPRVDVEVYFSPELYKLHRVLGLTGVTTLRRFIGRQMQMQHEPSPTSTSLLLNGAAGTGGHALYNLYDPALAEEQVCIPWSQRTELRLSTLTGVVLSAREVEDGVTVERRREAVLLVWKAWGHLIKDLHVHGDLDFLYVSIDREKEVRENEEYIAEVKQIEAQGGVAALLTEPLVVPHETAGAASSGHAVTPRTATTSLTSGATPLREAQRPALTRGKSAAPQAAARRRRYVPIPTDFAVIECTLERNGLPHNLVLEDLTAALTEMQEMSLEMLRLSIVDVVAAEAEEEGDGEGGAANDAATQTRGRAGGAPCRGGDVVPVLYAPKVTITHAGVIENGTHSFQRLRIRGSSLAHVQAVASALADDSGFLHDYSIYASTLQRAAARTLVPRDTTKHGADVDGAAPEASRRAAWATLSEKRAANGSFSATHARTPSDGRGGAERAPRRLVGHRLGAAQRGTASPGVGAGRYARHQTLQSDDHYMSVTDDERAFWRTHYYKLHDVRLLFHDRVDLCHMSVGSASNSSSNGVAPQISARLQEHLRLLTSGGGLAGELGAEGGDVASGTRATSGGRGAGRQAAGGGRRGGGDKARQRARKGVDTAQLPPEKLFEYLCTDMEAETALYDLHVGDCPAYSYDLTLRRIPLRDAACVAPAVQSLQTKGFINYFGPTRFASYTHLNMHPGLHLLKGEFAAAAEVVVQQFYIDMALATARRRTGAALPKLYGIHGQGTRLPDVLHGLGRRSVAEHGTALQRILHNALQATALLAGDDEAGEGNVGAAARARSAAGTNGSRAGGLMDDPCAEAFLDVVGRRACQILVQEFLCFVWNEIVNQRLQRYGTFSILPGDLVRAAPGTRDDSAAATATGAEALRHVSRREIAQGVYSHFDIVLPIPGADVALPENHTSDLYVVTLKRYGLQYNPEEHQWDIFYPRRDDAAGATPARSPYHTLLNSSCAMVEEEMAYKTPFLDSPRGGDDGGGGRTVSVDAAAMRPDLRRSGGNALGLVIAAGYRPPLVNPAATLRWSLHKGSTADPYHRWGSRLRALGATSDGSRRPSLSAAAAQDEAALTTSLSARDASLVTSNASLRTRAAAALGTAALSPPSGNGRHTDISATHKASGGGGSLAGASVRRGRTPPALPATPYWLPQRNDGSLRLSFTFPVGVYPAMMLRELTKSDVNASDVVDVNRAIVDRRAKSWEELGGNEQAVYRRYLARHRQRQKTARPHALSLALLHQHIFRSGGVRQSLLPTLRSYDSVAK